jgi:hypothetical protein
MGIKLLKNKKMEKIRKEINQIKKDVAILKEWNQNNS